MKSKAGAKDLHALSLSVGDFIRYWGFRRVHGAIWTQLYLSKNPLSGAELTRRLKNSKALVSPALAELEEWGLIVPAKSPDDKTKLYTAVDDVNKIIKHVLRIREQKLMRQINTQLNSLGEHDTDALDIDPARLAQLNKMVQSAQMMLTLMLDADDLMELPTALVES